MTRPTRIEIDSEALRHNVARVKACAPQQDIIAMVKANAYGCGVSSVVPVLDEDVDAFGVACLEEAHRLRKYSTCRCILFQGVFSPDELSCLAENNFETVVHQHHQLHWILESPLPKPIRVWVKVDTGMHRLGFEPHDVPEVITALKACPWVQDNLSVMTHLAVADVPENPETNAQLQVFQHLPVPKEKFTKSIANSAAILSRPDALADVVRPGIMLYGVSPFFEQNGSQLDLKPVMQFVSALTSIHTYEEGACVGYGGTWKAQRTSIIGVVPVGYGDGYPRHIGEDACVYIDGYEVPVVGRVSMDMLTVDLTECSGVNLGARVELWGHHMPVERVARSANTIGYELICQVSSRVRAEAILI